jgi:hypothetical protein
MTEPTTPTGKRVAACFDRQSFDKVITRIEREAAEAVWDDVKGEHVHLFDPKIGDWCRDCEQRAAAQERERLRNVWDGWQEYGMPPDVQRAIDSGDTPHVVWRLLTADPEPIVVGHTPPFDNVEKGERP